MMSHTPPSLTQRVTCSKPLPVTRSDSGIDIQSLGAGTPGTIIDDSPRRHYPGKSNYTPIDIHIKQIRDQIPAHLFIKSTWKSSVYLLHDLVLLCFLLYCASRIDDFALFLGNKYSMGFNPDSVMWVYKSVFWLAYWAAQGIVSTGIWVIAHECGHQAFSSKRWINNSLGLVLHSFLLVPYHSWRITHSMHHKSTNHLTRDQVFVPSTKDELPPIKSSNRDPNIPAHDEDESALKESPLYSFITMLGMLTFGWPVYILFNVSGQKYVDKSGKSIWASHFIPSSPIFEPRDYFDVVISNVGVLSMMGFLGYGIHCYGVWVMVQYYFIPYLIVNGFLVTITFLQHSHPDVPHYAPESFTFLRGALATIDRDYGILNYFFHHIADSHVAHHLFSQMPHYNAVEATKIVRQVLADTPYYHYDNTPIAVALYQTWAHCKFVEPVDNPSIMWYLH